MQNRYDDIKALDAEVIAVTTQDLTAASDSIDIVGVPFPLVYDTTGSVPKEWERYDNFGTDLADASVFVIDKNGKIAIDWGVYGIPETFIINSNGIIKYRHIGPITNKIYKKINLIINQNE